MKQAFYIRCRVWAFLCVVMEDKINHRIDSRLKHTASETANAKDDLCPFNAAILGEQKGKGPPSARKSVGGGEILPITDFLRIAFGAMLKGMGFEDLSREVWPIAIFAILILFVGVNRYRETLD